MRRSFSVSALVLLFSLSVLLVQPVAASFPVLSQLKLPTAGTRALTISPAAPDVLYYLQQELNDSIHCYNLSSRSPLPSIVIQSTSHGFTPRLAQLRSDALGRLFAVDNANNAVYRWEAVQGVHYSWSFGTELSSLSSFDVSPDGLWLFLSAYHRASGSSDVFILTDGWQTDLSIAGHVTSLAFPIGDAPRFVVVNSSWDQSAASVRFSVLEYSYGPNAVELLSLLPGVPVTRGSEMHMQGRVVQRNGLLVTTWNSSSEEAPLCFVSVDGAAMQCENGYTAYADGIILDGQQHVTALLSDSQTVRTFHEFQSAWQTQPSSSSSTGSAAPSFPVIGELTLPASPVRSISISRAAPDILYYLQQDLSDSVYRYNLTSQQSMPPLQVKTGGKGPPELLQLRSDSQGRLFVTDSVTNSVLQLDALGRLHVSWSIDIASSLTSLDVSPDGSWLFLSTYKNGQSMLFHTTNGWQETLYIHGHVSSLAFLASDYDPRFLVVNSSCDVMTGVTRFSLLEYSYSVGNVQLRSVTPGSWFSNGGLEMYVQGIVMQPNGTLVMTASSAWELNPLCIFSPARGGAVECSTGYAGYSGALILDAQQHVTALLADWRRVRTFDELSAFVHYNASVLSSSSSSSGSGGAAPPAIATSTSSASASSAKPAVGSSSIAFTASSPSSSSSSSPNTSPCSPTPPVATEGSAPSLLLVTVSLSAFLLGVVATLLSEALCVRLRRRRLVMPKGGQLGRDVLASPMLTDIHGVS